MEARYLLMKVLVKNIRLQKICTNCSANEKPPLQLLQLVIKNRKFKI